MYIAAQVVGVLAVVLFAFSYQLKKRSNIIILNAISNLLYMIQYILLGAFDGAAMNVLTATSGICAGNKGRKFIKKHTKLIISAFCLGITITGSIFYKNIFSISSIIAALLQAVALWVTNEKYIRYLSFCATPFWLIFNIANQAFGSILGNIMAFVSIGLAIYRYDLRKKDEI